MIKRGLPLATLLIPLCLFLALGAYQLQLPGLHYDEAKEAGLNAMQLVTRQPLTAFRDATVQIGPWRLPLMVQDYIGALNPLLAVPFLALARLDPAAPERGVIALRCLPLLIGAFTLGLAWCVARRLGGYLAAGICALLLCVNPAFIFWSRQGIFVTNLTALFFMASLLTGLRWWAERRPRDLWLTALFWGLGLYAKLLFAWAVGAMALAAFLAWFIGPRSWGVAKRRRAVRDGASPGLLAPHRPPVGHHAFTLPLPAPALRPWGGAALAFVLPLLPLLLYNLRTGGTWLSIFGNLGRSYYGVNNRAYLPNLSARLGQIGSLLRGDFLWYLGEMHADPYAVCVFVALLVVSAGVAAWRLAGAWRVRRGERGAHGRAGALAPALAPLLPLALLALIVAQSAFTVSDLFITHYSLLLPLIPLAAGVAVASAWQAIEGATRAVAPRRRYRLRALVIVPIMAAAIVWAAGDVQTTIRYQRVLTISGGNGAHSDAIERLSAYLASSGTPSAPLALDWGMDAPVRFLTVGRVNPIEVFGYTNLDRPDDGYAARLAPFLDNPQNLYLTHSAEQTVFHGRVEALATLAAGRGLVLHQEEVVRERSGRPAFVVYRLAPK